MHARTCMSVQSIRRALTQTGAHSGIKFNAEINSGNSGTMQPFFAPPWVVGRFQYDAVAWPGHGAATAVVIANALFTVGNVVDSSEHPTTEPASLFLL